MTLGIDIGTSALKLALVRDGKPVQKHYLPGHKDPIDAIASCGIDPSSLSRVAVTGVGAEKSQLNTAGVPTVNVPELDAIAVGSCALAGRERAVVAGIGTGTAFLRAEGGKSVHLGGTGIGGGTLSGMAQLLGLGSAQELAELALQGDLCKTDLTVGDLFSGTETLDPRLTASNLAKISPDVTKADWAAGMCNLVLQAIGTMALLCASGAGIPCIIATGGVTRSEVARLNFKNFETVYGTEYIVPPDAEFATAFGAALLVE
jgi:type II pantothenate kinase